MMAEDYRRALQECQRSLESDASAREYVYLTYVTRPSMPPLAVLDRFEQWTAVEQLYLNLGLSGSAGSHPCSRQSDAHGERNHSISGWQEAAIGRASEEL